jgi:hypothetical protein
VCPDQHLITGSDQQAPVGKPIQAERHRIYLGDHLVLPVEIDGDDLPGTPVGENQPIVVPTGRLDQSKIFEQSRELGHIDKDLP